MVRKYLLPLLGAALLVFALYHVVRAQQSPGKADPIVEPARSPFRATVAGTGMVEPDTEVIAVGSHHPGVVTEVAVKVGTQVEKGTLLFKLDDRQMRAELAYRRASLRAAEAQLAKLEQMPRPEELPASENVGNVTTPLANVPLLLAETNVVLAGIVSFTRPPVMPTELSVLTVSV